MTPIENANNKWANALEWHGLISGELLPPGDEKPRGLFSECGAPVPGASDE